MQEYSTSEERVFRCGGKGSPPKHRCVPEQRLLGFRIKSGRLSRKWSAIIPDRCMLRLLP